MTTMASGAVTLRFIRRPPRGGCFSERHSSTGMISVKTDHLLEALAQNDEKASSRPTSTRADQRQRIAREAADDGGDEALQADQEAGVVVDRGDGAISSRTRRRSAPRSAKLRSPGERRWECPSGARRRG